MPNSNSLPTDIASKLRAGERSVGVWGNGFIGFSTMAHFAESGINCVGYDIDDNLVASINDGEIPVDNLEYWLGFETEPLVKDGLFEATTNESRLLKEDVAVHFLAIPTEKDGIPWDGALRDVMQQLVTIAADREEPILVVVESTLTPGTSEDVIVPIIEESDLTLGEDLLFGVAPRRDWFISPDKNLRSLPRVFGGADERTTELMERVLGVVCRNLVPAPDHEHAELVKSIENAYRHVGITLANQLSRGYPDTDMREVLQLVGTKWNIPTYHPSVGTGGYCIPLASQYALQGSKHEEELSLLSETIETDRQQPRIVADAIAERGIDSTVVLGLAYKGDVKVDTLSPTLPIVDRLVERGVDVSVHDPHYDDRYIEDATDVESVSFPDGLKGTEAVLIVAGHRKYTYTTHESILDALDECALVLDNQRIWEEIAFDETDIEYVYTGGEGWLTPALNKRVLE